MQSRGKIVHFCSQDNESETSSFRIESLDETPEFLWYHSYEILEFKNIIRCQVRYLRNYSSIKKYQEGKKNKKYDFCSLGLARNDQHRQKKRTNVNRSILRAQKMLSHFECGFEEKQIRLAHAAAFLSRYAVDIAIREANSEEFDTSYIIPAKENGTEEDDYRILAKSMSAPAKLSLSRSSSSISIKAASSTEGVHDIHTNENSCNEDKDKTQTTAVTTPAHREYCILYRLMKRWLLGVPVNTDVYLGSPAVQ